MPCTNRSIVILGIALFCASCEGPSKKMVQHISGDSTTAELVSNGIRMSVHYIPASYFAERETEVGEELTDEALETYGNSSYFIMDLRKAEGNGTDKSLLESSANSYGELAMGLNNLAYGLEKNFTLSLGDSIIPASIYHYERSYDIGNRQRFLIGFPIDVRGAGEFAFRFDDPLYETGRNTLSLNVK